MKKDIKANKHLIPFVIEFDKYRQAQPDLAQALRYFKEGLSNPRKMSRAIKEIKKSMNISDDVYIKVIKDPHLDSAADIAIPRNLFMYSSKRKHKYIIRINTIGFSDFTTFVVCISHELSHLKLFLDGNKYWRNEKAVDTFAMLSGFGDVYFQRRYMINLGSWSQSIYGYLNNKELNFIHKCFVEDKRFQKKEKQTIPWYKKILQIFQS